MIEFTAMSEDDQQEQSEEDYDADTSDEESESDSWGSSIEFDDEDNYEPVKEMTETEFVEFQKTLNFRK